MPGTLLIPYQISTITNTGHAQLLPRFQYRAWRKDKNFCSFLREDKPSRNIYFLPSVSQCDRLSIFIYPCYRYIGIQFLWLRIGNLYFANCANFETYRACKVFC